MSRRKGAPRIVENGLTDLVSSVKTAALLTGGSTLSSYGTIGFSNNYSLITLNRIILTYLYTTNGIFQTAIQLPVQDAISRGIEIESSEVSQDDIDEIYEFWEQEEIWDKILDAETWKRLYGGSVLLINTNQDAKTPLDLRRIQNSPLEFYDIDRWQVDTNVAYFDDFEGLLQANGDDREFYYLWGKPIHNSRFVRFRNKRAPSYVRRQLRGWGMSEGERMIRDLNLYLKTQDVLYEILDESKIDVYHIKNLSEKLLTSKGTNDVARRVQLANELKNYVHALMLDKDEEFEQKTMTFSGLAEVMRENRIGVSAALRMPMTKLFGISASGFNAGEDDLEQYNQMVESEIRRPLQNPLRKLFDISWMYRFGYIPQYKLHWPAMRVLTELEQQEVLDRKANRLLSFYDRGLLESKEVGAEARKAGIITVQTKMEQGFLPAQPLPPNGQDSVQPFQLPAPKPQAQLPAPAKK